MVTSATLLRCCGGARRVAVRNQRSVPQADIGCCRRLSVAASDKRRPPSTRGWAPRALAAYLQSLRDHVEGASNSGSLTSSVSTARSRLLGVLSRSECVQRSHSTHFARLPPPEGLPPGLAKEIIREYTRMRAENADGVVNMLCIIAHDLGTGTDAVRDCAKRLVDALDAVDGSPLADARARSAQAALQAALCPLYRPILQLLMRTPGGVATVVQMREDALRGISSSCVEPVMHGPLRQFASEIGDMLQSWFSTSAMEIHQITKRSPAVLLRRLVEISRARSPHPVSDFDDLYFNRITPRNRRCYAHFHPSMPGEPLVFVEISVCEEAPRTLEDVLALPSVPEKPASVAVFYSITASQPGLGGLNLGGNLIRQVVKDHLRKDPELSQYLKRFLTLSPVPNFRSWLRKAKPETDKLEQSDKRRRAVLLDACVQYLTREKRRGSALDPVANFHLSNGAELQNVLWSADTSERRTSESHGIMASYEYKLDSLDENARLYLLDGVVPSTICEVS